MQLLNIHSFLCGEMFGAPNPISSPTSIANTYIHPHCRHGWPRPPPPTLKTSININSRARVVSEGVSAISSDPAQAELSWEIVVGALAGVAPFVVAGIEFSKRIVEQRNCKVCKGSGLVLRDNKYYFRCPRCGGFLPWQSWRRFFTG